MGLVFVNYRREDTAGYAGPLYDRLVKDFDQDSVFMEVSSLDAGDFVGAIRRSIGSANVMLALIGGNWNPPCGSSGRRRLENPDDYVRLELTTAQEQKLQIVPVLVENAAPLSIADLPSELCTLSTMQAWYLTHRNFHLDYSLLRDKVRRILGEEFLGPQTIEEIGRFLEERREHIRNNPLTNDRLAFSLTSMDPLARIDAYFELHIRRQQHLFRGLVHCLYLELFLVSRRGETRPLWLLLKVLQGYPRTFPDLPREERDEACLLARQILDVLKHRTDTDGGGHCKHECRELLDQL